SFVSNGDDASGPNLFVSILTDHGLFNYTGSSDGVNVTSELQDLSAYTNIMSISLSTSDPAGLAYNYFTFDPGSSALPEPATWAMLVGGFGAIGSAMRRRRTSVSFG
ncbi:MAG TPA: PEPxxWA-CTERM sorting domain-containing protein, partial [Sphingomonas sp.]|nr:PEPxxWA-CTERM sorting domain-containing protein [Sphingomonas sp.]